MLELGDFHFPEGAEAFRAGKFAIFGGNSRPCIDETMTWTGGIIAGAAIFGDGSGFSGFMTAIWRLMSGVTRWAAVIGQGSGAV